MITHTISSKSSYTSIAALIQRLPDELHPNIFREIGEPIVVSHVCRAWRKLALADPYLWSTKYIYVNHPCAGLGTRYPHMNKKLLELYLTRSRPAPICVEIQICSLQHGYWEEDSEEDSEEESEEVLERNLEADSKESSEEDSGKGLTDDLKTLPEEDFEESSEGDSEESSEEESEDSIEEFEEEKEAKCNCLSSLKLIMDHVSHIRKLQIHCEPYATDKIASILHDGFSEHQVPLLESFELSTYEDLWYDQNMRFYPENAPALRQLYLSSVEVPWDSNMLRNLTELYLCMNYGGEMNIDELFSILRACPDLTTLFFQFKNVAGSPSQITTHAKSINLLYLTDIILRNLPTNILQDIVRIINVPQHANWNIENDHHLDYMAYTMCDILRTIVAHMEVSQPRDLILALGDNCLTFLSSQLSEADSDLEKPRDGVFMVSFKLPMEGSHLDHIHPQLPFFLRIALFITAMNAANNIVRFSIRFLKSWAILRNRKNIGNVLYESSIWTKPLLIALPKLECLVLKLFFENPETDRFLRVDSDYYYYKRGFIEGMISNLVQDYNQDFLCPKLCSVEIMHGHGSLSGQLIHLLKSRSESGIPIRTLDMTWSDKTLGGIPLKDEWLNEAKKYVERVSVGMQADHDWDWHRPFQPKFEFTGDHHCNGALLGHFRRNSI